MSPFLRADNPSIALPTINDYETNIAHDGFVNKARGRGNREGNGLRGSKIKRIIWGTIYLPNLFFTLQKRPFPPLSNSHLQ